MKFEKMPKMFTGEIHEFCNELEKQHGVKDVRVMALSCFNVTLARFEMGYSPEHICQWLRTIADTIEAGREKDGPPPTVQ